jgi:hypothetical protein
MCAATYECGKWRENSRSVNFFSLEHMRMMYAAALAQRAEKHKALAPSTMCEDLASLGDLDELEVL